jgi:hypothetical protein
MSWLASWMFSTRTTRTPWLACKPIRRWWLTTRSTVLCQSVFELLDPGSCLGQLLFQWEQFCYQRFEESIFFSKGLEFFIFCHDSTLAGFLHFGKPGGDLNSYLLQGTKEAERTVDSLGGIYMKLHEASRQVADVLPAISIQLTQMVSNQEQMTRQLKSMTDDIHQLAQPFRAVGLAEIARQSQKQQQENLNMLQAMENRLSQATANGNTPSFIDWLKKFFR